MKFQRFIIVAMLICLVSAKPCLATDLKKISVSVSHSGDDQIGQRLAFALKEAIRSSTGYELVSGPKALLRVSLVSLDPETRSEDQGHWSAVAVTITMRNLTAYKKGSPHTWYPIYLTSGVRSVGKKAIEEVAKGILADVDGAYEEYLNDERSESLQP